MAHKKGQGATRNGRDSSAQYRGVKVYGGQRVTAGSILVRQVGSSFHAGRNVGTGKDYTLWSQIRRRPLRAHGQEAPAHQRLRRRSRGRLITTRPARRRYSCAMRCRGPRKKWLAE